MPRWLTALVFVSVLAHGPDAGAVEPNDAHYRALQWNLRAIALEGAWEVTTGSRQVVVAVIDSGIAPEHPDLAGRLLPGYDFISNVARAGDGDGWDDDPTDVVADPDVQIYHGTHIAGIIGAASNNAKGVSGVDWGCRILPIRAIAGAVDEGTDADIAAAIRWAAGLPVDGVPTNPHPAQVINLSLGGPGSSEVLTEAVRAALKQGSLVVAAAGNDGVSARDIYPAGIAGVITVGATDYAGAQAAYSNHGPVVEVMAPGGDLAGTLPERYLEKSWETGVLSTSYYYARQSYSYRMFDGTSVAAPQVTGVLSLMLAVAPELTRKEVQTILAQTSRPIDNCDGCGAGLIDAEAAVQAAKRFTEQGVVELVQGGCDVAGSAGPAGGSALAIVVLLLLGAASIRRRGQRTLAIVALVAGCAACSGTVDLTDEPAGDGGIPFNDDSDGGDATDATLHDDGGYLPTQPGEFCPGGKCGGQTACVQGICRQKCTEPVPGCNEKVDVCGVDEACIQAISATAVCLPAHADEGESCGGETLCFGGLECLRIDDQPAKCVRLCSESCTASESCETTTAGCDVCLPN